MKKLISILLLIPFTFYSVFAEYGDILYIKNSPTLVREQPNMNSDIIAELKKGYIVLEENIYGTKWTQLRLTDGKKGYILNFNLLNNIGNLSEIKGNYGTVNSMTLLRKGPTTRSGIKGLLVSGNKFRIINLNYFLEDWIRIEVLNGKSEGKHGFVHKKFIDLHCDYNPISSNLYDVFKIGMNIDFLDNTYCSRKVNGVDYEHIQIEDYKDNAINIFGDEFEVNEQIIEQNNEQFDDNGDDFLNIFGDEFDLNSASENDPINTSEDEVNVNDEEENKEQTEEDEVNINDDFLNIFKGAINEEENKE